MDGVNGIYITDFRAGNMVVPNVDPRFQNKKQEEFFKGLFKNIK